MAVQAVKDCTLSTAIALWRIVSVVNCCKLTTLGKVSGLHYMYVIADLCDLSWKLHSTILHQEPFDRLDKAYCDSPEKTKMLELQQTFKRIESPIDFLISLHNFIAVFVSHRSPTEDCRPKWRFVYVVYPLFVIFSTSTHTCTWTHTHAHAHTHTHVC